MSDLSDWSYLWERDKQDYVLLKVGEGATPTANCLIFNIKDHYSMIIEDDQLATELMERMCSAGVPILRQSDLPSGKSVVQQVVDDMIEAGKSTHEINEAIRSLTRRSPQM